MDFQTGDNVAIFDLLNTNNSIQTLKVLLPLFPVNTQATMTAMIKYLELRHVVKRRVRGSELSAANIMEDSMPAATKDLSSIIEQLQKYGVNIPISSLKHFTESGGGFKKPDPNDLPTGIRQMLSEEQFKQYENFINNLK